MAINFVDEIAGKAKQVGWAEVEGKIINWENLEIDDRTIDDLFTMENMDILLSTAILSKSGLSFRQGGPEVYKKLLQGGIGLYHAEGKYQQLDTRNRQKLLIDVFNSVFKVFPEEFPDLTERILFLVDTLDLIIKASLKL